MNNLEKYLDQVQTAAATAPASLYTGIRTASDTALPSCEHGRTPPGRRQVAEPASPLLARL